MRKLLGGSQLSRERLELMKIYLSLPVQYSVAAILWGTSLIWTILNFHTIDFSLHLYCAICTTISFVSLNAMILLGMETLGIRPKKKLKAAVSDFQKQLSEHRQDEQITVRYPSTTRAAQELHRSLN